MASSERTLENDSALPEQPQNEKATRSITGLRWALVCLAVFSSNFLYGLDNTIVADIQASIIASVGNVNKLGWLGIGFPLGSIAIILPIGKSYAIFNVKWLYIGSLAMFAAGSALCGGAPTMGSLIVGRVWAGAGGAGMYLGQVSFRSMADFRLTTPKERSLYMSIVVLVYGAGAILGPVIGGSLADSSSGGWRWAFYLNLFIFVVMAPIYLFLLPSIQLRTETSWLQKVRDLDWVGIVLSCGMYTTFAMIFTFGGSIWPWSDGQMIGLYVVFAATLIGFALQQAFVILTSIENRIFPIEFLRNPTLVIMFISTCCLGSALFITVYYLPLFFQFVGGDNGIQAAVRLLPFICFYVVSVVLNGWFMMRWGYYMPWFFVSGVFTLIGGALLYTSSRDLPSANIYGYSILAAVGLTAYQAAYSVVPTKVREDQIAEVILFINVGQQGSVLIALTIANTIFQNVAFSKLVELLVPLRLDVTAAIAGARSDVLHNAPDATRLAALDVLVEAIDDTYVLIIVAGAILLISSLFMKREKLTMEFVAGG
ncbi:hypothetical protein PG994_014134 [Apiospora phragmitis]|uniref:Major facilitator superfamily (MFS) profile domain-containing protein n=1 Tax=Apiospora phragmitis TaxID=2905665 RepID=A0ABR1T3H1_9PEZI